MKTTEEVVGAGRPRPRGGHTMVALGRDKLVVFGGHRFDGDRGDDVAFAVYDTVLSGNLSTAGYASVSLPEQRVLYFGPEVHVLHCVKNKIFGIRSTWSIVN